MSSPTLSASDSESSKSTKFTISEYFYAGYCFVGELLTKINRGSHENIKILLVEIIAIFAFIISLFIDMMNYLLSMIIIIKN
jgi:hypothetical protein